MHGARIKVREVMDTLADQIETIGEQIIAGYGNQWYIEDEKYYQSEIRVKVENTINKIKEDGGIGKSA